MKRTIYISILLLTLLFCARVSCAQQYNTSFPATENPISESGKWTSCGVASGGFFGDVATGLGTGSVQQATGTKVNNVPNGTFNDSTAVLTGTWGPNQTVSGVIHTVNQPNTFQEEVEIRTNSFCGGTTENGYEFDISLQSATGQLYGVIVRHNGPRNSFCYLHGTGGAGTGCDNTFSSSYSFAQHINNGDTLKGTSSVSGNAVTLTLFINNVQKLQVIDTGIGGSSCTGTCIAGPFTGGAPGIGFWNQGGTLANFNDYGFTSFSATTTGAGIVTANTCSIADITSAWATVVAATTNFVIPAGTCDWSAGFHFNAPSGSTSLTIQGAGNTTGSDSLGNPTGYNDQTVAQINSTTAGVIQFNASTAQTLLRVTGLSFSFLNSTSQCSFTFGGGQNTPAPTPYLRVDHNHWTTTLNGQCLSQTFNASWGVVDHNVVSVPVSVSGNQGVTNWWRVGAGYTGDGFAAGAYVWNQPTGFGGQGFLFFEDNFITGGYMNDCSSGGKQVWRYNTVVHSIEQGHEGTGDFMGCRATEYYKNNVTCDSNNGAIGSTRSGTMLLWGNTAPTCSSAQLIGINNSRTDGHQFKANPDWFYCGTGGTLTGPSVWDGNSLGAANASGYPCEQQPGRGQGDLVLGGAFGFGAPMRANVTLQICPTASTTYNSSTGVYGTGGQAVTCPAGYSIATLGAGTGSWPRNALEPIYEWMDTAPAQVGGNCNPLNCLPNRDYYQEAVGQTAQTDSTHPFNGLAGDGHGTIANRPAACNAGPGGQFGAGPPGLGGSPGTGYWDTVNNKFYVCIASGNPGTWALYYTPYTYPHPFVTGGTVSGSLSVSPTTESFGSVNVGSSSANQTATVTNATSSPVTVSSVSVGGTNLTDFPVVAAGSNCSGAVLPANTGTCTVVNKFTPSVVGAESATLTIATSGGNLAVAMSGTGVSAGTPATSYAPNPVIVGNVVVNQTKQVILTITNTGTAILSISANALGDTTVWSKNTSTCLPSPSVSPNGTCTIGINFSPIAQGNKSTTISITSNAPSSPDVINLSGSGILVPTTVQGVIIQGVQVQ